MVSDTILRMEETRLGYIPDKPQETLGGSVLLGFELVADEVLDVLRLGGSGELTLTEFLSEAKRVSY